MVIGLVVLWDHDVQLLEVSSEQAKMKLVLVVGYERYTPPRNVPVDRAVVSPVINIGLKLVISHVVDYVVIPRNPFQAHTS
jgi:hypothetical protein